jgi:UDP-N-acetylmuramate dehydrogenase
MDLNKIFSDLKNKFPKSEIYQYHPLASYTTVKIGGPADIFIHTKNSTEFLDILKYLDSQKDFITILGNGSNTLISDSGIRGIVIKNDSDNIKIISNNQVQVSSGVQLSQLINFTLDHNLLGLEEFAYIPSTIGGAIAGNIHGDDKNNFSKFVDSVEKYNDFIISATLKLTPADTTQAKIKVKEIIKKKLAIQPMNSLGSVFKNPTESQCLPFWGEKKAAGWIIDHELGALKKSFAYAQISPTHGNFIINNGSATSEDYFGLITWIQSQVQIKFGFEFELEIKLLGKF